MMSVFPSRNKTLISFILTIILLILSYETLQRYDQVPNLRDGSIGFGSSKNTPIPFSDSKKASKGADCDVVDQMRKENITVVMRTGATEAWRKLPVQLLSTLRCFEPEELLLWSDLDEQFGQYKTKDILATIPESKKKPNKDFGIYYDVQHYKASKQDLANYPNEGTEGHPNDPKAWTLDKYKFMRMLEESYFQRPDSNWFVFMEADTYFFWSNLVRWLKGLDSWKEYYLGSVTEWNGNRFGHGGSGFIMSKPALEKLFGPERGLAATWDESMKNECCGDYVVGLVMTKAGVPVKQAWPMLNGEYPESMEYGPDKQWCEPAVTMHHMPPSDVIDVWEWERKQNQTILISDIFAQFVDPEITANPTRISWDNLSKDVTYQNPVDGSLSQLERDSYLSSTKCEAACKAGPKCFQYLWKSGEVATSTSGKRDNTIREDDNKGASCTFSRSFKLGKFKADVVKPSSGEQWVSGWDTKKISEWVASNTCQQPKWVTVD